MEKRGKQILERAAELLDLPGDVIAGLSRLELIGSGTLLLDRHKGILSYGTEEIHVSVSGGVLRILGSGLLLRAMDAQALIVTGRIHTIQWIS